MTDNLIGGGHLFRLLSGGLAVEHVPCARKGWIVEGSTYIDGGSEKTPRYVLTRRLYRDGCAWHVRPLLEL
jgi:hypothetical protein